MDASALKAILPSRGERVQAEKVFCYVKHHLHHTESQVYFPSLGRRPKKPKTLVWIEPVVTDSLIEASKPTRNAQQEPLCRRWERAPVKRYSCYALKDFCWVQKNPQHARWTRRLHATAQAEFGRLMCISYLWSLKPSTRKLSHFPSKDLTNNNFINIMSTSLLFSIQR